jgi:acyl-CoA thioester hydrolase
MGWVYYATYLTYFEVGRTELIRKLWRPYRAIEDDGLRLPVVEAGCRYSRGARYDDLLEIQSRMTLPSPVRVRFEYRIVRMSESEVIAEGFTVHCFVSSSGRPVAVPADLKSLVEA